MTARKCPTCPTCGNPIETEELKGFFRAHVEPPMIFYRGFRLKLRPMSARVLRRLAASADSLSKEELRVGDMSNRTLRVHISAIRGKLPKGVRIDAEPGGRYRLVTSA